MSWCTYLAKVFFKCDIFNTHHVAVRSVVANKNCLGNSFNGKWNKIFFAKSSFKSTGIAEFKRCVRFQDAQYYNLKIIVIIHFTLVLMVLLFAMIVAA